MRYNKKYFDKLERKQSRQKLFKRLWLVLFVLVLFCAFVFLAHKSLEANEKLACFKHRDYFQSIEGYYITDADKNMCEQLGVEVY